MSSATLHFLGVDGGGSHCRARIRDQSGRILGEAAGGASNVHRDFDGAVLSIVDAASMAAAQAGIALDTLHAGLGLAGFVAPDTALRLEASGLPFASVVAHLDAYAACLGAFSGGDGGIVIAGTGSAAYGIVAGQPFGLGGLGFALGDQGSGAWLGHRAVRSAALALDAMAARTALIEAVLDTTGPTQEALLRWTARAVPKDYAQFAPALFAFAGKGDAHAMRIVAQGAMAISALSRALLARGAKRLCLLGGLAEAYRSRLEPALIEVLVAPQADALDGAIMMARKAQGLPEIWS